MKRKRKDAYFYPKLKGKRYELGYSLEDMGKYLGISKDCYYRKEKGKTDFYLCEVRKLLLLFNANFEDIFFTTNVNYKVDKEDKLEYDIGNKKYVFDNNGLSIEEKGE